MENVLFFVLVPNIFKPVHHTSWELISLLVHPDFKLCACHQVIRTFQAVLVWPPQWSPLKSQFKSDSKNVRWYDHSYWSKASMAVLLSFMLFKCLLSSFKATFLFFFLTKNGFNQAFFNQNWYINMSFFPSKHPVFCNGSNASRGIPRYTHRCRRLEPLVSKGVDLEDLWSLEVGKDRWWKLYPGPWNERFNIARTWK